MKKSELIEALAGLGDEDEVVLNVAIVSHEYGVNGYVNLTRDGLNSELAQYVREYWGDVAKDGDSAPESNAEAIDEYFDRHHGESLDHVIQALGN